MILRTALKLALASALLLTVESFDGWRPFSFTYAEASPAVSCFDAFGGPALMFDVADLRRRIKSKQDVMSSTRHSLESLGFKVKMTKDDEGRPQFRLTEFPLDNRVGKMMAASSKNFGIKFFIDPMMAADGEGDGDSWQNRVTLDVFAFVKGLGGSDGTLLHEIRHSYFSSMISKGETHPFQGEFEANSNRKLLKGARFYDDYMSFEELSTFYREAVVRRRGYLDGRVSLKKYRTDLSHLIDVSKIVVKNLEFVDTENKRDLNFEKTKSNGRTIWSAALPIERDEKFIGWATFEMPELQGPTDKALALQLIKPRIAKLNEIAKQYRAWAEAELAQLKE